ncbi:paired amphipathic helix protein Sin3-like 4 isoform X2 [Zingiber officinale]|uniref:paired amphipathic helix protein Sin3-like 4 isoform X2 n=1 Tax=Zingiber officinale TaxID=94328 RepID=UPI001C4B3FC2|nr:paired amphipathic helix protein Sin3-like 4 isoform X2 [Zingiber officinale]
MNPNEVEVVDDRVCMFSRLLCGYLLEMKLGFTRESSLVLYFNSLLSRWKPITFEESLHFVKKVKARDFHMYMALFEILSQKDQMPSETYHDLLLLFESHDDLLKELMRFKPHNFEGTISQHNSSRMSLFLVPLFILSLIMMFEQPMSYFIQQAFRT